MFAGTATKICMEDRTRVQIFLNRVSKKFHLWLAITLTHMNGF